MTFKSIGLIGIDCFDRVPRREAKGPKLGQCPTGAGYLEVSLQLLFDGQRIRLPALGHPDSVNVPPQAPVITPVVHNVIPLAPAAVMIASVAIASSQVAAPSVIGRYRGMGQHLPPAISEPIGADENLAIPNISEKTIDKLIQI